MYDTHKKTVKVGRDTFEDVEFFENNYPLFERGETFKEKLEDSWDNIACPFYVFKRWIKNAYWEVRYGFQRMFKGYDSVDTFETFAKFIERYTKILTEYRNNHYGYIGTMTKEEWDNTIDEMIYHLHYMNEDNVNDELKKNVPENWLPKLDATYKIMEMHKDEFFKLFSKYFYALWD